LPVAHPAPLPIRADHDPNLPAVSALFIPLPARRQQKLLLAFGSDAEW